MPDDILARIESDLARCEAALVRAEEAANRHRAEATRLRNALDVLRGYSGDAQKPATLRPAPPGTKSERMVGLVLEILRKTQRPMSIAELADYVQQSGVEIGGKQPRGNLAGALNRDGRATYTHGVGWSIAREAAIPSLREAEITPILEDTPGTKKAPGVFD